MSSLLLMEFNAKPWLQWDWENLDMFNAVAADDPKETTTSVAFDFGLAPLSRSFNSTSIISFSTGDAKMPNPTLTGSEANQEGINLAIASKLEASVGSGEPLITLKLGRRAYFDRSGTESSTKSSYISGIRESSATSTTRSKSGSQRIQAPCCQVEGCNLDLSLAKDYHRKHKVCENHSKCPQVVVDGLERRFCQQCSRFHGLTEFDEKKRSCRRRLSDHNARRRKPQTSSMQFNASELLSSYNDEKQEIHFAWNDIPRTQARHEMTNDSLPKLAKEGVDMWLHLPAGHLKSSFSMHGHDTNGLFSSAKDTISEISNPDREGSIITSNVDASPDLYHALSLLSKDSLDLSESRSTSLEQCRLPQGSLLDSTCWRLRHQSTEAQPQNYASATLSGQYFEERPPARTPYESDFHSAWLN